MAAHSSLLYFFLMSSLEQWKDEFVGLLRLLSVVICSSNEPFPTSPGSVVNESVPEFDLGNRCEPEGLSNRAAMERDVSGDSLCFDRRFAKGETPGLSDMARATMGLLDGLSNFIDGPTRSEF